MMEPWLSAGLGVLGTLVVLGLLLFLAARGDGRRLKQALGMGWRLLRQPALAERLTTMLEAASGPARPSAEPLRLLTLLQREGRLLDFLLEDLQGYADAQIGAAVRDIQRKCQQVLREHLQLAPVLAQEEGAPVEVPVGFDPSAIQLTGNVAGQPPFRGILRHHGWRVRELRLPAQPAGQDEWVVQPAEVELP